MKQTFNCLLLLGIFWPVSLCGQIISASLSSANPTTCQNTSVSLTVSVPCGNSLFQSWKTTIIHDNGPGTQGKIIVEFHYSAPDPSNCPPPITYTNQVNLGQLLPLNYCIEVQMWWGGAPYDTEDVFATPTSCCPVNSSFSAPTIFTCTQSPLSFQANDTSLMSYNWKVDGQSVSSSPSMTHAFLSAGMHQVSLTATGSSCSSTSYFYVELFDAPSLGLINLTHATCSSTPNGSITVSVPLVGPNAYTWSNGGMGPTINGLYPGTYSVQVDFPSCIVADTFEVNEIAQADFNIAGSSSYCFGDTILLVNTSPQLPLANWEINGQDFGASAFLQVPLSQIGNNQIQLISSNADSTCMDTLVKDIQVASLPSVGLNQMISSCGTPATGSIDVSASGGIGPYSYLWSSGHTTSVINQVGPGSYSLTVSDSLGCSLDTSFLLPGVMANINLATDTIFCPGDSFSVFSPFANPNSIQWYDLNSNLLSQQLTYTQLVPDSGFIDLKLVLGDSICGDSATYHFQVSPKPSLNLATTDQSCPGEQNGSVVAQVSGGKGPFSYHWSTQSTANSLDSLGIGTYALTLTDSAGCSYMDTASVNLASEVFAELSLIGGSTALCGGNTVVLESNFNGLAGVQWRDENGGILGTQKQYSQVVPDSGSLYLKLVVWDAFCLRETEKIFPISSAPLLSLQGSPESCPGNADGNVIAMVSGGTMPLQYSWSSLDSGVVADSLPQGTYIFYAQDAVGCVFQDSISIGTLGGIEAGFNYSLTDSSLYFTDVSSPVPQSWWWTFGDGQADSSQNPIHMYDSSGQYVVCLTVMDSFGCQSTYCDSIGLALNIARLLPAQLDIYPNPTAGRIRLVPDQAFQKGFTVRIWNGQGQLILRQDGFREKEILLNLSHLAEGVYHIHLSDGEKAYAARVIKME